MGAQSPGSKAVIIGAAQILAHVPDLVFSGSKPRRQIAGDSAVHGQISAQLRDFRHAAGYLPNQVFIGAAPPRPLTDPQRPWWQAPGPPRREGAFGRIYAQPEFLAALQRSDSAGLIDLAPEAIEHDETSAEGQAVARLRTQRQQARGGGAEPLPGSGDRILGEVSWGYPADDALSAHVILENTCGKASGALALIEALSRSGVDAGELDWVISCSEEAVGDRYQRGGGNLGKAIAEAVGADRASGFDVKNFCAAPIPALIVASALIESGVGSTIAVVAGGCTAKLGMKYQGHLDHQMPVLEDCLGAVAVLLRRGASGPAVRLDAVGKHSVAAGGTNQQIFEELVFRPLEEAGLKVTDVGAFGTELHNPELTEPQGSGDVPLRNYKMIAALAARKKHIDRSEIDEFLAQRSFAGFAPTQGHIASGICLVPHVLSQMAAGQLSRAQLVAKASLFLGKMSSLSDGASVLLEV